jgi:hypothetical protein
VPLLALIAPLAVEGLPARKLRITARRNRVQLANCNRSVALGSARMQHFDASAR